MDRPCRTGGGRRRGRPRRPPPSPPPPPPPPPRPQPPTRRPAPPLRLSLLFLLVPLIGRTARAHLPPDTAAGGAPGVGALRAMLMRKAAYSAVKGVKACKAQQTGKFGGKIAFGREGREGLRDSDSAPTPDIPPSALLRTAVAPAVGPTVLWGGDGLLLRDGLVLRDGRAAAVAGGGGGGAAGVRTLATLPWYPLDHGWIEDVDTDAADLDEGFLGQVSRQLGVDVDPDAVPSGGLSGAVGEGAGREGDGAPSGRLKDLPKGAAESRTTKMVEAEAAQVRTTSAAASAYSAVKGVKACKTGKFGRKITFGREGIRNSDAPPPSRAVPAVDARAAADIPPSSFLRTAVGLGADSSAAAAPAVGPSVPWGGGGGGAAGVRALATPPWDLLDRGQTEDVDADATDLDEEEFLEQVFRQLGVDGDPDAVPSGGPNGVVGEGAGREGDGAPDGRLKGLPKTAADSRTAEVRTTSAAAASVSSLAVAVVVSPSDHSLALRPVSTNDVLFGRGNATDSHPGNVRYRRLVGTRRGEYTDAGDTKGGGRYRITADVVRTVTRDWGGLFLRRVEGAEEIFGDDRSRWTEAADVDARRKAARALGRRPGRGGKAPASPARVLAAAAPPSAPSARYGRTTRVGTPPDPANAFVTERDVLLGRGMRSHPGNERYRGLVAEGRAGYDRLRAKGNGARRRTLRSVADEIVDTVTGPGWGGRFLLRAEGRDDGAYVVVDASAAAERVSSALGYQGTKRRGGAPRPPPAETPWPPLPVSEPGWFDGGLVSSLGGATTETKTKGRYNTALFSTARPAPLYAGVPDADDPGSVFPPAADGPPEARPEPGGRRPFFASVREEPEPLSEVDSDADAYPEEADEESFFAVRRGQEAETDPEPLSEVDSDADSEAEPFAVVNGLPDPRRGPEDRKSSGGGAKKKAPAEDDPVYSGLKSRPKVDGDGNLMGNWDLSDPLHWSEGFGRRSAEYAARLERLVRLRPGDEGYFDVSGEDVPNVSVVRTKEQARRVMERLLGTAGDRGVFHACDTEVMDIDLKSVGPVGNGYVTCVSVYSGPEFDYGLGEGPGTALWIDNLDDAAGVLAEFKEFFEREDIQKVWHNYGFDRHVMWNEGIDCRGLAGDTMHMARLQDTSRSRSAGDSGRGEGYSLEALTASLLGKRKKPMKELFGVPRLCKDGRPGSLVDVPPVEVLQRDPQFRQKWIMYSAYDAEGTWQIREELQRLLEGMAWVRGRHLYDYYTTYMARFAEVLTDMERRGIRVDARDYLAGVEVQAREDREYHLNEFRRWAAKKIGPDGLALNPASSVQLQTFLFGGAENVKTKEPTEAVRVFKVAREEVPEEAMAAYREQKDQNGQGTDPAEPQVDEIDLMKVAQLKVVCKDLGLKVSGKKAELQDRIRGHLLVSSSSRNPEGAPPVDGFDNMTEEDLRDACKARGLDDGGSRKDLVGRLKDDDDYTCVLMSKSEPMDEDGYRRITEALEARAKRDGSEALQEMLSEVKRQSEEEPKYLDVKVTSIGMEPQKYTAGGAPSVTADVLKKLAGDPLGDDPKYGTAYEFFGGGEKGHEACVALYSLTAIGSIDTMIANFLTSLQSLADDQSRVHCSLNLNTETGRLSSRRPNLQNQPALEKDKYKIRKAFQSSPGNNLIVADYGQLELRLLASMTNCKSMIEAFEAGGDFHSRTALGMFDYIQKKVEDGECLLEWDYSKGDPPKPMLKDEFASERRKAKTLNFSIAYGKTAHGLSSDWNVSQKEAAEMLEAWYKSRPEVLEWQEKTKKIARDAGYTRTLMGRYRQLPDAMVRNRAMVSHAERASINTPIQGGAADVAMMAMIKINDSELLQRLGWVLLMQIHDEVILEGPEETAEEAFAEVTRCMQEPWVFGLEKTSVPLLVDGSFTNTNWYDAK